MFPEEVDVTGPPASARMRGESELSGRHGHTLPNKVAQSNPREGCSELQWEDKIIIITRGYTQRVAKAIGIETASNPVIHATQHILFWPWGPGNSSICASSQNNLLIDFLIVTESRDTWVKEARVAVNLRSE